LPFGRNQLVGATIGFAGLVVSLNVDCWIISARVVAGARSRGVVLTIGIGNRFLKPKRRSALSITALPAAVCQLTERLTGINYIGSGDTR
jgi:hypothetical protein